MVVYDLICELHHCFEGWFKSSEDFVSQQADEKINCPVCASVLIRKLPTASYISTQKSHQKNSQKNLVSEMQHNQKLMLDLKNYIIQNTDDVGEKFTEEAKKIHYGEVEARNIRGIAKKEELKDLADEGIEVINIAGGPIDKQKLN